MNPPKAQNDQPKQMANGSNDELQFNAFKKFLIDNIVNLENKAKNTNEKVAVVELVELTSVVSGSAYSYFLRSKYIIDSRSLLKRINLFLYQCPETFKVDYEAGKVRLTTEKEKSNLKKRIVELCSDFLILCLSFQSDCMIPTTQLYEYLMYSSDIVKDYFKDYKHFLDFLNCSKDLFYIEDDYVCQADLRKKIREKRNINLYRREETRIDEKLIDKITWIYNSEMGERICKHVLSSVKIIAIDTEGTHLGSIDGLMTLVQVAFVDSKLKDLEQATIVDNIHIYFFDVLRCPSLVDTCIKPILESERIIKVLHDSRNDSMSFHFDYALKTIRNIFDTSKAYFKLSNSQTNGLHTVYEEVCGLHGQNLKPRMKQLYQQNDRLWEERPLTDFLKFYAALDVLALLSIYLHLQKKYDFSKFKKSELFIHTLSSGTAVEPVYKEDCMNPDEYDSTEEELENGHDVSSRSKNKSNKFNSPEGQTGPYISRKKTPEDLEKLRKRFANLERLARGEVRFKNRKD